MSKRNFLFGEKHYTATVFILSKEQPLRILLVNHKKMKKWLPPGGHQEGMENSYEAAIRETKEEVGIDIVKYLPPLQQIDGRAQSLPLPRCILEERIEAHKDQPEHFHLDMIYVVQVPYQQITNQEELQMGWFTTEELDSIETFENVRTLVKMILGNTFI